MDNKNPEEARVRKTVTLTHKQMVGGTSIVAALVALGPVKDMFVTNDKFDVTKVQIQELREAQKEIKSTILMGHQEVTTAINRGNDMILKAVKESEERGIRAQEKLEKRMDRSDNKMESLEASALRGFKR